MDDNQWLYLGTGVEAVAVPPANTRGSSMASTITTATSTAHAIVRVEGPHRRTQAVIPTLAD